jgi:DNA/RNA endonuclease G (NUC1)
MCVCVKVQTLHKTKQKKKKIQVPSMHWKIVLTSTMSLVAPLDGRVISQVHFVSFCVPKKPMLLLKLLFDQNSIIIRQKSNNYCKSRIILIKTQEDLITLLWLVILLENCRSI